MDVPVPALVFILVLVIAVLVGIFYLKPRQEGFQSQISLHPTLWWFVDDETNARKWWDFGARNSRKPNRGYLEVALEVVKATQWRDFQIVPLLGRAAVSQVLAEAGETVSPHIQQLPATIWRQWAMANLLAVKGGLAMMGDSTLCVGPSFATVTTGTQCAVFGITPNESRALPGADVPPAQWVGWSLHPHQPVWDVAATTWNALVAAGPTAWSAAEARRLEEHIWTQQALKSPKRFQAAEGSRKADGTEWTPEDFLGKQNPVDPKVVLDPAVLYIPMDGDTLVRSYRYSWFVRMSKAQILESNFYWAMLAKEQLI
jgi:hypothetical protein